MSPHGQSRTQTHWQETQARICNRNGQHLVTQCDKWADTGSAVMSTVNKGTNAGFVAFVRTRSYSKPFLSAQTRLAFSAPTHFWRRGSSVSCMSSEILLLTSYFEHPVGFRSEINVNLMHDMCFLTRDGRLPLISGADCNFPPSPWQDSTLLGAVCGFKS